MNSYKNIEEQQKAAKVRELTNEALELALKSLNQPGGMKFLEKAAEKGMEADKLSFQLVNYLRTNYPNNFKIKIGKIPEDYEYYFINNVGLNEEEQETFYEIMKKLKNKTNNHDILILSYQPLIGRPIMYVFFNDNEVLVGTKISDNKLYMPIEFYQFMEEMGLTLKATAELYDFPSLDQLRSGKILTRRNVWPNRVSITRKLI